MKLNALYAYVGIHGTEDNFMERNRNKNEKGGKKIVYQGTKQAEIQDIYIYAFQILLRASVTPTSLVSNSYRPTAVARVKPRRSQFKKAEVLGTRHGRK